MHAKLHTHEAERGAFSLLNQALGSQKKQQAKPSCLTNKKKKTDMYTRANIARIAKTALNVH